MSKSCIGRIFQLSIDTVVMQLRCILVFVGIIYHFTDLLILISSLVWYNTI